MFLDLVVFFDVVSVSGLCRSSSHYVIFAQRAQLCQPFQLHWLERVSGIYVIVVVVSIDFFSFVLLVI